MKRLAVIVVWLLAIAAWADVLPPKPPVYFNDYAKVVSPRTAQRVNEQLADFERQSSDQILVAIYPKMPSDSDMAEYCTQVARSWKVGQPGKDNGAVIFVFTEQHKYFVVVGYGLEGALPDALCKTIMEQDAVPKFKRYEYGEGLAAAVNDLILAAKGEYKGTGRTRFESQRRSANNLQSAVIIFIVIVFVILRAIFRPRRHGWVMGAGGWGGYGGGFWGGGNWGGGGGGSSGGGGWSGFSGGGGSFGGGGAGGSW